MHNKELPQNDCWPQVVFLHVVSWTKLGGAYPPPSLFYRFEYLWKDEGHYRRATALPAQKYISLLFQATEQMLNAGATCSTISLPHSIPQCLSSSQPRQMNQV